MSPSFSAGKEVMYVPEPPKKERRRMAIGEPVKRKRARRLEREGKRSGESPQEKSRPGEIFAKSRYIPSDTTRDFSDFTAVRTIV